LAEGIVLAGIERLAKQNPRAVYHVAPGGLLAILDDLRARRVDPGIVGITQSSLGDDFNVEGLFCGAARCHRWHGEPVEPPARHVRLPS
jgi:hypothetical protein